MDWKLPKRVRDQNYNRKKIQVIVLDNDSNDGTQAIVKKYKTRVVKYKQKNIFPVQL